MAAGFVPVAASAGVSLRMPGAGCEGPVVAVTAPVSSLSSCCRCVTLTTSAAPHAATNTDADATILTIETRVTTTTRGTTDRYQHYKLTLRRFRPLIKSGQATIFSVNCADQCCSRGADAGCVRPRVARGKPEAARLPIKCKSGLSTGLRRVTLVIVAAPRLPLTADVRPAIALFSSGPTPT